MFFKLVSLVVFLEFAVAQRRPCLQRVNPDPGKGGIYCVCNSTYCDDFPSVRSPLNAGQADIIETSKAGKRADVSYGTWGTISVGGTNTIVVDVNQRYQTMIGFGGAFTDAAGINMNALSIPTVNNFMNSYFAENGLRYTVARVPIASCDFSARIYSYEEQPNDWNQTTFALQPEDFLYKIKYIQQAQEMMNNRIKLFASPWSSPSWMKTNENMTHGGTLKPGDDYGNTYAKYFVKFFESYLAEGISFWGLTPQNEPQFAAPWQALFWNPEDEANFVGKYLGPAMATSPASRDVLIMTLDHNRDLLPQWADTYFANSDAARYTPGIAVHWYGDYWNHGGPEQLDLTHASHSDKFILYTEACTDDYTPGNWQNAHDYAYDILDNVNHWVQGWTDWNLAVDLGGGPNWIGNWNGAPILVNGSADEFYKQPHYYVMGHFSKFVLPDSVRVGMQLTSARGNVTGAAFDLGNDLRALVIYSWDTTNTQSFEIRDLAAPGFSMQYDISPQTIATIVYRKPQ